MGGEGRGHNDFGCNDTIPTGKIHAHFVALGPELGIQYSGARGPPQFLKKRSENAGANENLSGGFAAIPGIAPRVAPRIVGFVLIKS